MLQLLFGIAVNPFNEHGKCSKISNISLFQFSNKMLVTISGLEFTNFLSELQIGKTLIRLLLQKQSDLGLPFLSRPFWQASSSV